MIKKTDLIVDIIKKNPDAHKIMVEAGLHCIGCGGGAFESLEDGARAHGIPDEKIDKMVEEINGGNK